MANLQSREGSSTRDTSDESSESTLQLNIKTLDSRIFSFHVDKNILVSAFKDKIACEIGIPVGQQRLIFRGKVLKDDHLLSEYNVEKGDTLHVVQRQPQLSPGSGTGEATSRQDYASSGPHNHMGQISHSVVLGPLNVGDAGEAFVPDLSQVIGAVLNSVGLGNLAGGMQPGVPVVTAQANEAGGPHVNGGSQTEDGNQTVTSQGIHGQSASYPRQTPMGAAIVVPSLNMPIPDSLNTLTEFMNQMESVLSQNDQPPTASSNPLPDLPRNSRGYPTVEALTIVLQQAQQFLRDYVVPALSHAAGRLNQERDSNDPLVREQVQTDSMQLGVAMQHLGALLLELGRTILALRLGQSPEDSYVNAGPAVYISPSGPNPIMVQPSPLQSRSLFGDSSGAAPSPLAMGAVGIASAPRNVNIHIHTVANRAFNGEDMRGTRTNGTDSDDSGRARVSSGINVSASTVPSRPGAGVSQASDSNSTSSIISEITSLLRTMPVNRENEDRAPSESSANQEQQVGSGAREDDESSCQRIFSSNKTLNCQEQSEPSTSSQGGPCNRSSLSEHTESHDELERSRHNNDHLDRSSGVPLGLGLGGLQPKRRGTLPRGQDKRCDDASSSNQDKKSVSVGQQVLQSLASVSARENLSPPSSTARQNEGGETDVVDAMSQVLGSPLDGLLAGVSQQTGVGSPDMVRNMLQQFTQNPAMRNTMSQIAQQMDGHDLVSMFSGLDSRGQGGGIDLSSMMQQMMPIVSQALGGISSISQLNPPSVSVRSDSSSRRDMAHINDMDLRPVVQRLEDQGPSVEIFRSLLLRAVRLSNSGSEEERILNDLCSQRGLAQEFMEMLRLDVSCRLNDQRGS